MTNNTYCYVYAKDMIGIKTNVENFSWTYGTNAPCTSEDEYKKCKVKVVLNVLKDSEIINLHTNYNDSFQCFYWDEACKTVFYNRSMLGKKFVYSVYIKNNTLYADFGKTYYKYIGMRIMNIHPARYILSDLVNIMLIRQGYASLYCSSVFDKNTNNAYAFFAPPNTGKTITAMFLCENYGYKLISEDAAITDGSEIIGCPYTNSYRKPKGGGNSAGSFGRASRNASSDIDTISGANLAKLISLSKSKDCLALNKLDYVRKIEILNGYIFNYCSSPIVKVMAYFDNEFYKNWQEESDAIVKRMIDKCDVMGITDDNPAGFAERFIQILNGNR